MNTLKTFLLMAVLTVALVFIGGFVGGQSGALIALVLAGAMNFASYFFSDRIVLKMYRAREVGREEAPELYDIVEHLSRRAGLPMPRVAILPQDQPNAFATPRKAP
jgi:heat shock protein HtpX